MTTSDDTTQPATESTQVAAQRQLRPGLKLLLVSLIIGIVALVLFCYSLGLGIKELAGDVADVDRQLQVKRLPLAIAMVGFGVSMLVFWIGYLRLARSRGR